MQEKDSPTVAATVITLNEEETIEKCLKSLRWADEIIVVDSYSNDRTVDIVRKFTKNVYLHQFRSNFSELRNFAIKQVNCDWILVLDADETVDRNAEKIIRNLIRSGSIDGYWLPRRNYINSETYLKYGYFYPDYQLRLFRNQKGIHYRGLIHELPNISAERSRYISSLEIYHLPTHTKYNSFLSIFKLFKYSRIEGPRLSKTRISNIQLVVNIIRDPVVYFYRSFIKLHGYKDGYYGFRAAVIWAVYQGSIRFYALLKRLLFNFY